MNINHIGGDIEYSLAIEKNALNTQLILYNNKIDFLRQRIIWILDNFRIKHSSKIASGFTKDIITKLKNSSDYKNLSPELQVKLTYKVVKKLKKMDIIFAKLFTIYEKLNKIRVTYGHTPINYYDKYSNKYSYNKNNNNNNDNNDNDNNKTKKTNKTKNNKTTIINTNSNNFGKNKSDLSNVVKNNVEKNKQTKKQNTSLLPNTLSQVIPALQIFKTFI